MSAKSVPPEAIVAGHVCLDVIPLIEEKAQSLGQYLVPGKLNAVGPALSQPGGTVPNTGLALHLLGIRTKLIGKVGRDLFGTEIVETFRRFGGGLADGLIVSDDEHTSYTLVINPPGVDRIFFHCTGANDTFTAGDVREEHLSGARLFHFGYPPLMRRMYEDGGRELAQLLAKAKKRGLTVSLDMARPDPESPAGRADWRAVLAAALPHVDLFLPSFEEILYMLRPDTYREWALEEGTEDLLHRADGPLLAELAEELLAMGVAAAAIKLGEHGLYLRTSSDPARIAAMGACSPAGALAANWLNRELLAPCFAVEAAGTTGAGDATIAGFLGAVLKGLPVETAMRTAVGTGAFRVERPEPTSGIPSWEELMKRIDGGWEQRRPAIALPGWQFDSRERLWTGTRKAE